MLKPIQIEILGYVHPYIALGIQILTACLLGGIIGFDRERKMKSAGFKTNMLICLGSTLYTSMSMMTLLNFESAATADPNRISAQIVSGIGFLGAGAIIQGRGSVVGLTTAATIWVVAAIGVTIGMGYPIIATIFTLTIIFVLQFFKPLYKLLEFKRDYLHYHLEVTTVGELKEMVERQVLHHVVVIDDMFEEVLKEKKDQRLLHVYLHVHPRRLRYIIRDIKSLTQVQGLEFHRVNKVELSDKRRHHNSL